jgi:hypothetical protein
MRPFSQKQPFAKRDILIQGNSVRQTWGFDEPSPEEERKPLRRYATEPSLALEQTDDQLRLRLGEELDYARRMLHATGDELSSDPIAVSRHGVSLQNLDMVDQILGHIANVIRSVDPETAVKAISMGDLKARLTRRGSL